MCFMLERRNPKECHLQPINLFSPGEAAGSTEPPRDGGAPPPPPPAYIAEMLASLGCIPGLASLENLRSTAPPLLYISFHPVSLPQAALSLTDPRAPNPLGLLAALVEAPGICSLTTRGCTLIHLYHRKQKTSLTSHLFHR